jgi:hypothetical protein
MNDAERDTSQAGTGDESFIDFTAYCAAGREQGISADRLSRSWNMLAYATRCLIREDVDVHFRSQEFPVARFLINRPGEEIDTDSEEVATEFRDELVSSGIQPDVRTVKTVRATSLLENYGFNYKTAPFTWTPLFKTAPPQGTGGYRVPHAINLLCLQFIIAEVNTGSVRLREVSQSDLHMHARVLGSPQAD